MPQDSYLLRYLNDRKHHLEEQSNTFDNKWSAEYLSTQARINEIDQIIEALPEIESVEEQEESNG